MELRITAFKGSPWQCGNTHEAVLEVRGRNANPDELLGAHLVWRTATGRVVRGKVVKRHGHLQGHKVVARFHKGLSGDALGSTVEVRARAAAAQKRAAKRPAAPAAGRPQAKAARGAAPKPAKAAKPAAKVAAKPAAKPGKAA
jgi:ribosomal protein L35AE/L33A